MGTILFNNSEINFQIEGKSELKNLLKMIFLNEKIKFKKISYVFCNDNFLLSLNNIYLKHNTLTDILTFTLSNDGNPIDSEIYISVERIKENAASLKVNFLTELHRVMIHGILHLCGYLDKTSDQKKKMRKREDYYLQLFHVKRST